MVADITVFDINGFYGTVVPRGGQPGIFVPPMLFHRFKPKSQTEPATRVHVRMVDDPDKCFNASVAKVNRTQRIVHVTFDHTATFVPGTECFVTMEISKI